jgi:hypothetical protein
MITEINGRYTCTNCEYEWSAMSGDTEIPDNCDCEKSNEQTKNPPKTTTYEDWQKLSQEEKDEFKLGV